MAITNAQQYKQLMQKGGRIGLKGGADMGTVDGKNRKATNRASNLNVGAGGASFNSNDKGNLNVPTGGNNNRTKTSKTKTKKPNIIDKTKSYFKDQQEIINRKKKNKLELLKRLKNPELYEDLEFENELNKSLDEFTDYPKTQDSGFKGLTLGLLDPDNKSAVYTRDFFASPKGTKGLFGQRDSILSSGKYKYDGTTMTPQNFGSLPVDLQNEVYSDYMSKRLSGEIDAAGNPNPFTKTGRDAMYGIDAKSAGAERGDNLLPVQEKVIPEVEEEDPTAYRFLADGGRAAFQEGGGIFPRLNQLGSNVSSAEQELAALNSKIDSAESTLGEGGGDEGGLGSIMPEDNNFTNPTLEAFSGAKVNVPVINNTTFPDNVPDRIQIDPNFKPPGTLQTTTGGGLLNNFAGAAPSTNLPGSGAPQAGDVVYDPTGMPNIFAPRNGYADGGMSEYEGGIMDLESGRQQYFLGKLVKKAGKAIKKITKSKIGKAALLGAVGYGLGGGTFFGKMLPGVTRGGQGFGGFGGLSSIFGNVGDMIGGAGLGDKFAKFGGSNLMKYAGLPTALSLLLSKKEEEPEYANVYDDFELKFPKNQYRFAAEGGRIGLKEGNLDNDPEYKGWKRIYSMSPDAAESHPKHKEYETYLKSQSNQKAEGGEIEPVAKKTMPLLDMDGKEMDLRAEGGFVPIGRMEKADDVPARLSKNEFVFTADAVRNAGDGNVDKGAEVMYNMMKNLESGGDVSEESQGLSGAREMFQTSKRLEEVL